MFLILVGFWAYVAGACSVLILQAGRKEPAKEPSSSTPHGGEAPVIKLRYHQSLGREQHGWIQSFDDGREPDARPSA